MTPTEYSDVKRLYKFAIAYDSFSEISRSCEHLITAGTESTAPEYDIMAAGIVTIYGRPFTNNARIGMISTSLVPSEFKSLHSTLVELRKKRLRLGRRYERGQGVPQDYVKAREWYQLPRSNSSRTAGSRKSLISGVLFSTTV
jgi:TPR repeat protein